MAHASPAAGGDGCTVVHTHAAASTALSAVGDGPVGAAHYYCALFGGALPVTPYATFGSRSWPMRSPPR